jgi:hypothetical protein
MYVVNMYEMSGLKVMGYVDKELRTSYNITYEIVGIKVSQLILIQVRGVLKMTT